MKEAAEAKASVLKDFDSQHLANTASACTIDGHASPELYTVAIAAAATSCSTDFTSQRLANTDWAFAKAGQCDAIRMEDLANTAISSLCAVDDTPDAQYLAQALLPFHFMAMTAFLGSKSMIPLPTPGKNWMVWTISTEFIVYMAISLTCAIGDTPGLASPELFNAITEVTDNHLKNFNSQRLANMDWAFATGGHAQYLAQALLPFCLMAMTAFIGSRTRIPFPTPGKAWMIWTFSTFSTELLAYMAVSLTCAIGNTPGAQYLVQAWNAHYIMAMTASISIGAEISIRHLARLVWFGLSAAAMGGKNTCCAVSRPDITSLLHNGYDCLNRHWHKAFFQHLERLGWYTLL